MSAPSSSKTLPSPTFPRGYPRECEYCFPRLDFFDPSLFARHLRVVHATKEGGSYVCRYGENNVCQSLPLEGVSDVDYEAHIRKFHIHGTNSPVIHEPTMSKDDKVFTSISFTQNLSAVLWDPGRSSTEQNTFFTTHWGDGFLPSKHVDKSHLIPPVSAAIFQQYMQTTVKTYKQYKRARKALLRIQCAAEDKDAEDLPTFLTSPSFLLSHSPTFSALFCVPSQGMNDPLLETKDGHTVLPATPQETDGGQAPGSFRDYNSLHARLESMHDVVDSRLAGRLVSKSGAFWQMVASYGSLHDQLAQAIQHVKRVRLNLKSVSHVVCDQSKKIIALHKERERKMKLLVKLRDMACLRQAQSSVQMMLNQGDFAKAVECIETSHDVLRHELTGVKCFRHLGTQLDELYGVIGRMMHEEFASIIQKEFGLRNDEVSAVSYEGELCCVVVGLVRVKRYSFVHVLRSEIQETIKCLLRQVVKSRIVDSGLDLTSFDPEQLGEPVRRLSTIEWNTTLDKAQTAMTKFCLKLQTMQDMILELVDRVTAIRDAQITASLPVTEACVPLQLASDDTSSDPDDVTCKSSQADPSAAFAAEIRSDYHLKRVVGMISEFGHHCAQVRLCRLLQARHRECGNDATTPQDVVQTVELVREYQRISSEQGWYRTQALSSSPLSVCINKLILDFIDRFHVKRRAAVASLLDREKWKACEVKGDAQKMVAHAITCGILLPLKKDTSESEDNKEMLMVEDESFVVVGSAVDFVSILAEYGACVTALGGSFAPDILSRIVELLKAFNSRSCQLILGAGALQLVGLRTISVRNLALAFRSLQLIVRLVPLLVNMFRSLLPESHSHLLRHFNQVVSDYGDHMEEIRAKLVSVIDHHTVNCLATWELKGTVPSSAFQQICKQLGKFHNGMMGVMPREHIQTLFERVHENSKNHMKLHLAKKGISPHDALQYGFASQDYAYYCQNIVAMSSCTDMKMDTLNDVVYGR